MGREDPQLKLRLNEGLRDQVAAAAKQNNRSMNAEIVDRLERSFAGVDLSETIELDAAGRLELARHRLRQVLSLLDEHELSEMLK